MSAHPPCCNMAELNAKIAERDADIAIKILKEAERDVLNQEISDLTGEIAVLNAWISACDNPS